jgi:hypothetical protein
MPELPEPGLVPFSCSTITASSESLIFIKSIVRIPLLSLAWETLVAKTEFSTNGIGRVWARGDPPGGDPDVLAMLDRAGAMDGTTDLGAMFREISDMVFPPRTS